jgi:glucose 1-dehydrogenase/3-dehydrosphinganine reductase
MTEFAELHGKRALITGADRGIGAGIARALAAQGARVFLNTFQPFEYRAGETDELYAFTHQADVRDEQSVQQLFHMTVEQFGGIDILVNNAGVESIVPALDLTMEEWDRIHLTNLRGAFLCAQAAARLMKLQPAGGVIVNISSIHDSIPRLGAVHYSTAKAGLSMMTKSLAQEWAEYGIRVVGVSPGAIDTERNQDEIAAFGRDSFEEWIPLGRIGTVGDIANAVAFLASEQAAYITGTTLLVDGAYSLNTVPYDPRKRHAE